MITDACYSDEIRPGLAYVNNRQRGHLVGRNDG
jgi:hypothetical protein